MTTISDRPTVDGASKAPTPSRKPHLAGSRPDLRVPMREVLLSTGDSVVLYDTSGPYTDPSLKVEGRLGLPALRADWIAERGDTETYQGRPARPEDDGRKTSDLRNLD